MLEYKDFFKGKRVTLMGLGLLGRGVGDAQFLAECGADVTVTDLKTEAQLYNSIERLKKFTSITFHLGGHSKEDFQDKDLILMAPSVPLDSIYIAEAKKNNIPVRMSADLFAEFAQVPIVGITGTRGKSTVTHMIAHILKTAAQKSLPAGRQVLLGGNVRGVSTLSLLKEVTSDTIAVLELDSWQLQGFREASMSPHVAVFTTFFPDHMNYYGGDKEKYFADKANIFLNQTPEDTLILGEQVTPFVKEYGYEKKVPSHVVIAGRKNLPKQWKLQIPGEHNRYNAGLAVAAADALGIDTDTMCEALESFPGLEGRLEFLGEKDGVKIYNDNNSTTPEATIAALQALGNNKNIVLIVGGSDKNLELGELVKEINENCKSLIPLAGSGTDRLLTNLMTSATRLPFLGPFSSIEQAVKEALVHTSPGDTVLFSPAFASFGMFTNEYDRNDQFKKAVENV